MNCGAGEQWEDQSYGSSVTMVIISVGHSSLVFHGRAKMETGRRVAIKRKKTVRHMMKDPRRYVGMVIEYEDATHTASAYSYNITNALQLSQVNVRVCCLLCIREISVAVWSPSGRCLNAPLVEPSCQTTVTTTLLHSSCHVYNMFEISLEDRCREPQSIRLVVKLLEITKQLQ